MSSTPRPPPDDAGPTRDPAEPKEPVEVQRPDEPTTDPEPPTARTRLRRLFSWRDPRAQVVVAVLLGILGFAAVTQVQQIRSDDDFSGQRRDELIELLDSLSAASDRARSQVEELEQTRSDLQSSSDRREEVLKQSQQRLEVLQILAGTVAAEGPGVTVTIDDPDDAVDAATLLDGIEAFRDAGAEAIEINDVARVVASSAITSDESGVISVDGVELRPPYVIDVIGSSHELSEAVRFPGGLTEQVARFGGTVEVEESNTIEVGSLHTVEPAQYSQPSDG
jgi:uncharacterized protein YlxW (UPF0749 family)